MLEYREVICNQYGVNGVNQLLNISEQDLDSWKSVPVGFRIKIRKIIN